MIEITTQKIYKGQKAETFSKKYIKNEFFKLEELIDKNEMHKFHLNKMPKYLCRYEDIIPYKENTIKISTQNKEINGSWINIPCKRNIIVTQGPLEQCIDDFWSMCFDYNINSIVMLCNEIEEGVKKCSKYWEIKNSKIYKVIKLEKKFENEIFLQKNITIQNLFTNNNKTFFHIQFKKWPDHQIPDSATLKMFENLFEFIDNYRGDAPPVIHCSAGIGRSGVFIALYLLYKEIIRQISTQNLISFNIFNLVRKLKESRIYMVENINQYQFIYNFIEDLLNEKN